MKKRIIAMIAFHCVRGSDQNEKVHCISERN